MKLHLAPMEGLIDWVLRDVLTSIGGIDQCSTEFIRVTDRVLPDEIFFKFCPELDPHKNINGETNFDKISGNSSDIGLGRTRAGIPVLVQLLGGHPEPLAASAKRAAELGALGVDFNFGCPAKTVNRHDGGATLLKYPDRIFKILELARREVPKHMPVTAKIRLGFNDPQECIAVAQAVEASGVKTLTVHCRTKTDLYKPPAYWEWISKIKEKTQLNIIANGEIWTADDLNRCRAQTGCDEFMIGRGAIADPFIFNKIKQFNENERDKKMQPLIKEIIPKFYGSCVSFRNEPYAVARTKQWLAQMSKRNPDTLHAFDQLKIITQPQKFHDELIKQFC